MPEIQCSRWAILEVFTVTRVWLAFVLSVCHVREGYPEANNKFHENYLRKNTFPCDSEGSWAKIKACCGSVDRLACLDSGFWLLSFFFLQRQTSCQMWSPTVSWLTARSNHNCPQHPTRVCCDVNSVRATPGTLLCFQDAVDELYKYRDHYFETRELEQAVHKNADTEAKLKETLQVLDKLDGEA